MEFLEVATVRNRIRDRGAIVEYPDRHCAIGIDRSKRRRELVAPQADLDCDGHPFYQRQRCAHVVGLLPS